MTVYLSEYIYPAAVEKLRQHATIVDNFDHIEEIDAIILRNIPVTAEMMDRAKKLKVIAKHGIGVNTIDVKAAKERGIQVIYTPTANADSVAEMTVGLFLALERRIYEANAKCRRSEFTTIAPSNFLGTEILGKTFGQIGMGNIAQRIAHIMSAGFGAKVLGYDPFVSAEEAAKRGFEKVETLEDWFELCLMAFGQGHGSTPSGLALARCVDPDHKAANCWEGFGVALGCVTPITSALAAILPILAVQSQWIPVGIGAAVTLGCILFGELVTRRQN